MRKTDDLNASARAPYRFPAGPRSLPGSSSMKGKQGRTRTCTLSQPYDGLSSVTGLLKGLPIASTTACPEEGAGFEPASVLPELP